MAMPHQHEPPATAGGSFCVIGLAHGSRHPQVRTTIESLLRRSGEHLGVPARAAFLDLTDPDLETVCAELAAAGHTRAVVVPLLFTEAFHASVDVPEAIAAAASSSGLDLVRAEILGTGDDVADVLLTAATAADLDPRADVLLYAVGSSRPQANAAVADLAARLGKRRGTKALAGFGTVDPRAGTVLAQLGEVVAVVPLVLAPGLLLDPMATMARERGWGMADPLGDLAVDLVVHRYRKATRSPVG